MGNLVISSCITVITTVRQVPVAKSLKRYNHSDPFENVLCLCIFERVSPRFLHLVLIDKNYSRSLLKMWSLSNLFNFTKSYILES